jgi:hypothetical protein
VIYLKSLLAGIAAALATIAIGIAITVAGSLLIVFHESRTTGSGGIGTVFGTEWIVGPTLIAFIAAFFWQFRRSSRAASGRRLR